MPWKLVMVAAALIRGTIRATSRSATSSEVNRTFLADKSRWMMGGDRSWRKARPLATLCSTRHFRPIVKGLGASRGGGWASFVSGSSKP